MWSPFAFLFPPCFYPWLVPLNLPGTWERARGPSTSTVDRLAIGDCDPKDNLADWRSRLKGEPLERVYGRLPPQAPIDAQLYGWYVPLTLVRVPYSRCFVVLSMIDVLSSLQSTSWVHVPQLSEKTSFTYWLQFLIAVRGAQYSVIGHFAFHSGFWTLTYTSPVSISM